MHTSSLIAALFALVAAPACVGAQPVRDDLFVDAAVAAAVVGATWVDAGACEGSGRAVVGASCLAWTQTAAGEQSGLLADAATLAARFEAAGIDGRRPVFVYGDWAAGWGEEGRIWWALDASGITDVHIVRGGVSAVDAIDPAPVSAAGTGAPAVVVHTHARATLADVDAGQAALIDVRTLPEYLGATFFGEARGGHVDGATHLALDALLEADAELGADAVRALLLDEGVSIDGPIIVYCTGGVRSALATAVLRSAGLDARNYDGSWWEYAAARRDRGVQ